MSFDVEANGEHFNITYNMAPFLQRFGVHPRAWNGRERFEVAEEIRAALAEIAKYPVGQLAEQYDAPNGWGTVVGTIRWLEQVAHAFEKPHDDIIRVY